MAQGERASGNSQVDFSFLIAEMADLLSVMGNPSRLGILLNLWQKPCGFGTLLKETGLKKSALANQLRLLHERGLVVKVGHGNYRISEEGAAYLEAILEVRRKSEEKKQLADEGRQREEVARAFLERN